MCDPSIHLRTHSKWQLVGEERGGGLNHTLRGRVSLSSIQIIRLLSAKEGVQNHTNSGTALTKLLEALLNIGHVCGCETEAAGRGAIRKWKGGITIKTVSPEVSRLARIHGGQDY